MDYKHIYEDFDKTVNENKILIWLNQKCKQCNYCNNCIFCKLFKQIFIIEDYIGLMIEKPEIFKNDKDRNNILNYIKLKLSSKLSNTINKTEINKNFDIKTAYNTYNKPFMKLYNETEKILDNKLDPLIINELNKLLKLILKVQSKLFALIIVDDIKQNNRNEIINSLMIKNILEFIQDYNQLMDLFDDPDKYINYLSDILYYMMYSNIHKFI